MDSEIVKYLLFIPVSLILKYIESRYLSDVRKRKNHFENIPDESIRKCITRYTEFGRNRKMKTSWGRYIHRINSNKIIYFLLLFLLILVVIFFITFGQHIKSSLYNSSENEFLNNSTISSISSIEQKNMAGFQHTDLVALNLMLIGATAIQLLLYLLYNQKNMINFLSINLEKLESEHTDLKDFTYLCDLFLIEMMFVISGILYEFGFSLLSIASLIFLITLGITRYKLFLINKLYIINLKQRINKEYKKNFPIITVFTKDSHIATGKIESVFTDDVIYLNDGEETTIVKWASVDTLHIENRYINLTEVAKT